MTNLSSICRLCGSAGLETRYLFYACRIATCSTCGFYQTEGIRPDNVDSLYTATYFNKGKYVNDRAGYQEQARRLNFLEQAGLAPGSRILDAGCATGDFLVAGQARYEMWGQDISLHAVQTAHIRLPELSGQIRAASLDCLDYPYEHFDAVVLWDVLEHLLDPCACLAGLSGILRNGGLIFVSTPNIGALTARFMGRHWAFLTPPEHLCFFSERTLRRFFTTGGYSPLFFKSLGKWVNFAFFMHKLRRIYSFPFLDWASDKFKYSVLGRTILYVPTGDVLYAAARKTNSGAMEVL